MYDELLHILYKFTRMGPTLWLTSPKIKEKHFTPHDQVMAIGLAHRTVHGFTILQRLWDIARYRMVITFLESDVIEVVNTTANEQLYIYTHDYIIEQIEALPGDKNYVTMYMDRVNHGYKEVVIMLERTGKNDLPLRDPSREPEGPPDP